jgi:aspartate 1-decarboxylase
MLLCLCRSKLHRLTVTATEIDYEGSITLDCDLLDASGIVPGERVQVLNLNTGGRLETYVIPAPAGSGTVCLNGPAARTAVVGDPIIVIAYAWAPEDEAARWRVKVVRVDEANRVTSVEEQ